MGLAVHVAEAAESPQLSCSAEDRPVPTSSPTGRTRTPSTAPLSSPRAAPLTLSGPRTPYAAAGGETPPSHQRAHVPVALARPARVAVTGRCRAGLDATGRRRHAVRCPRGAVEIRCAGGFRSVIRACQPVWVDGGKHALRGAAKGDDDSAVTAPVATGLRTWTPPYPGQVESHGQDRLCRSLEFDRLLPRPGARDGPPRARCMAGDRYIRVALRAPP
jgi:hypothetical protein